MKLLAIILLYVISCFSPRVKEAAMSYDAWCERYIEPINLEDFMIQQFADSVIKPKL